MRPTRERAVRANTTRLAMVLGLIVGTALNSWWFVALYAALALILFGRSVWLVVREECPVDA